MRGDNAKANFEIAQRLLTLWKITVPRGLNNAVKRACDGGTKSHTVSWVRIQKNDVRLQLVRQKRRTEVGELDRRILPQFAKRSLKDLKFIHGVTARVRALEKVVQEDLVDWKKVALHKKPRLR